MGDSSLSWVPVIGTAINAWSQERNLEENANQSRIQREWQEEMWNKNNQYNTPSAQKERLEAAGINPYSVLAQGGADTGVSSSPAQSYERAKADFHSPMDENAFLNSQVSSAQIRSIELDNDLKGVNLEFARIKAIADINEQYARTRKEYNEAKKSGAETDYLEEQLRILSAQANSLITKSESEARISTAEAKWRDQRLKDEHLESETRQILNKWNARLSKSQSASLQQGIKESLARIRRMEFENRLTAQQVATEIEKAANYWADSVNKMTANPKIAAESAFASELQETMIGYYDALTVGSYTNSGNSILNQLGDYWNEYNVLNSADEVQTSRRYVRDNQGNVTEIHDTKKGTSKQKRKKSKSFRRR